MLPAREIERIQNEEAKRMSVETMERLFAEMDPVFVQFLMRKFAELNGLEEPGPPLPFERAPKPAINVGTNGPPPPRKMAQLQNLKGKLGN